MKFPVLRFNDLHIIKFESVQKLNRMRERDFAEWDNKIDTFIIDSQGDNYRIKEIRKARRSFNPLDWIGPAGALLFVEHIVEEPMRFTLDEIKRVIVELIAKNGWYRQGAENEAAFRTAFENFERLDQLIANISFYGSWQG